MGLGSVLLLLSFCCTKSDGKRINVGKAFQYLRNRVTFAFYLGLSHSYIIIIIIMKIIGESVEQMLGENMSIPSTDKAEVEVDSGGRNVDNSGTVY